MNSSFSPARWGFVELPDDLALARDLERPAVVRFRHERIATWKALGRATGARVEGLGLAPPIRPDELHRAGVVFLDARLFVFIVVVEEEEVSVGENLGIVLGVKAPRPRPTPPRPSRDRSPR